MKKSRTNVGIQIENNIRITSDAPSRNLGFVVIMQVFLILIGVIAILYSWVEGFSLYVDHRLLLYGVVITVLVHVGLNEIRRYQGYFFLLYFAIVGGLVYYFWKYIENGFYCLENAVIKKAAVYYGLNPVRFVVNLEPAKSTTALLLLITQAIALVVGLEVYKHYMRSVYLFLVLSFYGGLLAVGVTPSGTFLVLVLLSIISFNTMDRIPGAYHKLGLFQRNNYHEFPGLGKQRLRVKAALMMITCFLVSILLVRLIVTKEYYEEHIDLTERKVKFQKTIREFSVAKTVDDIKDTWNEINPFSGDNGLSSGGLDSGRLGNVGEVKFTGETALEVSVDKDVSYLYLKGFAGGLYDFDEWIDLSEDEMETYEDIVDQYGNDKYNAETLLWEWLQYEQYNSLNQYDTAELTDIYKETGDVTVDYKNANPEFLYAPYSSNYQDIEKMKMIGDQYIVSRGNKTNYVYFDSFLPYETNSDLNQLFYGIKDRLNTDNSLYNSDRRSFLRFETAYRDFVHEAYTRLPSSGLKRLRSVEFDDSGYGVERTANLVNQVLSYLYQNTDYSLSPGVPAEGQDFVEYFLFDKKEGFCSHYATAAVLLLRNYEVPARYVEGYIVSSEDIQEASAINGRKNVTIKDYNAHAWIEVYVDEVGWVPVEVTKGYSNQGVSNILPEIESSIPSSTVKPTSAIASPTPSKSPEPSPKVTKKPSLTPTKPPIAGDDSIGNRSNYKSTMWNSLSLLGIICFLILLAFFFTYYIVKRKQKIKQLTKGLPSNQGIYTFELIMKLLRHQGIAKADTMSYSEFALYTMNHCPLLPLQFEEIVELALKAKFAKEGITIDEANRIYHYYTSFYTNIYQSESKKGRILLQFNHPVR